MSWLSSLSWGKQNEGARTNQSGRGYSHAWVDVDTVMLWMMVLLMVLGLVMVYSASIVLVDSPKNQKVNASAQAFFYKHLLSLAIGAVAAYMTFRLSSDQWRKLAIPLFLLALLMLTLVFVPGLSHKINGARRWIDLRVMNFQPTELLKFSACLYMADFCTRRGSDMLDYRNWWKPLGVMYAVAGILVMLETDLGAFFVFTVICLTALFLAGARIKVFAVLSGLIVAGVVAAIIFAPFRMRRFVAYLNPWANGNELNGSYQLTQSLIAFGRGELWGQGLGASVQKMFYLPEAHTDFILAVIAEEFGLLGVWAVIAGMGFLVYKIVMIGRECLVFERNFQAIAVHCVAAWLGVQSIINIGVCTGALPTKGLTLPLISYGGSALMMNCMALAFVLRVDSENRKMKRGEYQPPELSKGHVR